MKHFASILLITPMLTATALAGEAHDASLITDPVPVQTSQHPDTLKKAKALNLDKLYDEALLVQMAKTMGAQNPVEIDTKSYEASTPATVTYNLVDEYQADVGVVDDPDRYFKTKSAGYPDGRFVDYTTSKTGVAISRRF